MLSRTRVFTSLFFSKGARRALSSDENFINTPHFPKKDDTPVYPCSFETPLSEGQENFEERQEETKRDDEGRRKGFIENSR